MVPLLPRVTIFSATGRAALALASVVVTRSEFQVHSGDFDFLVGVLDAQVGETDLAVNNRELQLVREGFLTALGLTLAPRLGPTKFSVELFLEFIVELNPEHLATFAFDLVGSLLVQAIQGGIMVCFLGLHKARVNGLIVEYEAVSTNQAFALLCQSENLLGLPLEYARVSSFDKPLTNQIAKIAVQS